MMTVAEKLTKIAENEPKVYEAGHDAGYTEGLNKGGYADGYEEGKKAEYDAFWDALQQNGTRTLYESAFQEWNGNCFKPKYDLKFSGEYGLSTTFRRANGFDLKKMTVDRGVAFDTSEATKMTTTFQNSMIGAIPPLDLRSCTNMYRTFYAMSWDAEFITKTITLNNIREDCVFDRTFGGATYIENLMVTGTIGQSIDLKDSTKLSADSIINIIEHLSLTASGKTLTLSRTAVDTAIANGEFGDAVSIEPGSISGGGSFYSNPIYLSEGDRLKVELTVSDNHFYPTATYDETKYDYFMADPQYWGVSLYYDPNGEWSPPDHRSFIHTATADGSFVIEGYFAQYTIDETTPDAIFSIRAVLIDEDGNEITGENLYSAVETSGVSNIGGWDALEASKPNWNISLV